MDNKQFYDKLYKRKDVKRRYFQELAFFLHLVGDTKGKSVVSIGNGNKDPLFRDQIVSDISLEGLRRVLSGHKCVFDAHHLPFKEGSIDVFYGWQVVHHLDIDRFFPELKFALKDGGRAVFVDNAYSPQWRLVRKLLPRNKVDPKEDLREDYLAGKAAEYGFSDFTSRKFNFFAYLFNKFMRGIGLNISFKFLERLDSFCSRWPTFRNNLRNMVWSFNK